MAIVAVALVGAAVPLEFAGAAGEPEDGLPDTQLVPSQHGQPPVLRAVPAAPPPCPSGRVS